MSRMKPENVFLTAALSVIGVAAVAGYIAVIAPTYDSENRIPTPEEFALTVKAAEPETEAPAQLSALYAAPEPEERAPETEPAPETVPETEVPAETEPAPEPDPDETTLDEWFALVEERTRPKERDPEETTLDEWFEKIDALSAADPDKEQTGTEEPYSVSSSFAGFFVSNGDGTGSSVSVSSGEGSSGASISWGVSSTDGEFLDIQTDENSRVTVTQTEDGYSSVTSWSDGEGTSSFSGTFAGEGFRTYYHDPTDDYVLNTKSKTIHSPTCGDIEKISPENYATTPDFDSYLDAGYTFCGHCLTEDGEDSEELFQEYLYEETEDLYVLNTNPKSKKIHKPHGCSSVDTIKPEHYATTSDLTSYLADGYTYCGKCFK